MPSAKEIVEAFQLQPHPEGGHYRETFRDDVGADGRALSTAIYFLLQAGEVSHWHRVDATEHWLYHAGAPLVLTVSENGHDAWSKRLGPEITVGQHPQIAVPAHAWQTAESLGDWTLVSCVVAPGFEFSGFELAPADWRPLPRGNST